MKPQNYQFNSRWEIPATLPRCSAAIIAFDDWKTWWPGLISTNLVHSEDAVVGTSIEMTWRSMLGYKLALRLTITDYTPQHYIAFTSAGDLAGTGSWAFSALSEARTQMEVTWQVATQRAWMNIAAPLLKPVFIAAHHRLMAQGERGLRAYLG
jgi:hypothetical protein